MYVCKSQKQWFPKMARDGFVSQHNEERGLGERASRGRRTELTGETPTSSEGNRRKVCGLWRCLCDLSPFWRCFLSVLAEKLPQKGTLWQPTLQSVSPSVRSRKLQKGLFGVCHAANVFSLKPSSLVRCAPPRRGPSQALRAPRETPFCGPWSSGGSVKVSARLGPSPGGPGQQQHPGPHPGVGEGDWKHWRRSRMWMPHRSEQRPCQGLAAAFRRTPQNKEGLNTTSEYQQGHLAPQLRPTLPPLCQGLPPWCPMPPLSSSQ